MELQICMPAIVRPKMVEENLSALVMYLKGVDFSKSTLYLNIDPVPIIYGRKEIENIAKKYIGNVITNYPNKGHYPTAFIWLLKQVKNDNNGFFLWICDDWKLIKDVYIQDVISRFNIHSGVKSVSVNNSWEHGSDFGITKGKHPPLERDSWRGEVSFFDIKLIHDNVNKLKPNPCPIEGELSRVAYNKNTCYSLWLTDEHTYYCKDLGGDWKRDQNISSTMFHKCARYKICNICGNQRWRFICYNKNGEKCEYCDVLCSKECWRKHCIEFHNEKLDNYICKDNFKNNLEFNKYHSSYKV